MSKTKHGKLRYVTIEKDGQEARCLPQALDVWERNGWTAVDDGDSEEAPFYAVDSAPVAHNGELPQVYGDTPDDLSEEE